MYINKTMKKQLAGFMFVVILCASFMVKSVAADGLYGAYGSMYGQYGGGGGQGKVLVDKLVRNPSSGEYVDNIGLNDPKYVAQNAIFFKIIVENTGNSVLTDVKVVDTLPAYVEHVSGGQYDAATRQVTFSFDTVRVGERRSTILQVRVVTVDKMPAEKGVICPVNKVVAYAENSVDEDTAQFCIEKKVMAARVPETGDPAAFAIGLGSLSTLFAGVKMRRIGKK